MNVDSISIEPCGSKDVNESSSVNYEQDDLNKVGQYLSKHKNIISNNSKFSLKQVFDLLEKKVFLRI